MSDCLHSSHGTADQVSGDGPEPGRSAARMKAPVDCGRLAKFVRRVDRAAEAIPERVKVKSNSIELRVWMGYFKTKYLLILLPFAGLPLLPAWIAGWPLGALAVFLFGLLGMAVIIADMLIGATIRLDSNWLGARCGVFRRGARVSRASVAALAIHHVFYSLADDETNRSKLIAHLVDGEDVVLLHEVQDDRLEWTAALVRARLGLTEAVSVWQTGDRR